MKKIIFATLVAGVSLASAGTLLDVFQLGLQAYNKGNYKNAVEHFQKGCDAGSPYACERLAQMHAEGKGVPKNAENSKRFYEKACNHGLDKHCANGKKPAQNAQKPQIQKNQPPKMDNQKAPAHDMKAPNNAPKASNPPKEAKAGKAPSNVKAPNAQPKAPQNPKMGQQAPKVEGAQPPRNGQIPPKPEERR